MRRVFIAALLLVGSFVLLPVTTEAAVLTPLGTHSVTRIVLEQDATISVHTYLGQLNCETGLLIEVSPEDKSLYRYGKTPQTQTLGPYAKGSQLVFGIVPDGCEHKALFSTDKKHAILAQLDSCNWRIIWEDLDDSDFNDLYTDIYTCGRVTGELVGGPFNPPVENAVYKLPWPKGVQHTVTNWPGNYGTDHYRSTSATVYCCNAYDFAMNVGASVSASTDGTVLWVEDGFGPGTCDWGLVNKANAVVIQPEGAVDVNLVYLHLLAGSIKVQEGQHVKQGQVIAQSGESGYTCNSDRSGPGPHLHFEWTHHCYDLADVPTRRQQHKGYYCGQYEPTAPLKFTSNGQWGDLAGLKYESDNQIP